MTDRSAPSRCGVAGEILSAPTQVKAAGRPPQVPAYRVSMAVELTTGRLLMRGWTRADQEPFARLNADPEVMEHFPSVLSPAESNHLIELIENGFARRGWGL